MSTELFVSLDCEALGGNPFENYVFNWGFVAKDGDGKFIDELSVNMLAPEGHKADQDTLAWFHSTPEMKAVYEQCTKDAVLPEEGMRTIEAWFKKISPGYRVSLVCYPTIFDGTMLYNYWFRYLGHPAGGKGPGFTVIDIRSYAAGKFGISVFQASQAKEPVKNYLPKDLPHTHFALDDAREQLDLFLNLRKT